MIVADRPMKRTFECGKWHAWQGSKKILLSDESIKVLRAFDTTDDCINWLYMNDEKAAAMALACFQQKEYPNDRC